MADRLTISVNWHDGLYVATCEQIPELFVADENELAALAKVPEAIEGLWALENKRGFDGS